MRKCERKQTFTLGILAAGSARACVGQAHAGKVGQRSRRRLVMLIVDADVGVSAAGIVHRCAAHVHFQFESFKVKTDLADDVSAF